MNLTFLADLFFPRICLYCGIRLPQGSLCETCRKKIVIHNTLLCGKCHARLPYGEKICHVDFPYVLGAAGSYRDEVLKALIHHLKFRYVTAAAEPLADILSDYVSRAGVLLPNTIIIPIPLSRKRERMRGFNQSERIARRFADLRELPLETHALVRIKHAKPQSETKSIEERSRNIRGSFAVTDNTLVFQKNIFLVDDVATSGATLFEAARTLKSAGAKKIIGLACAKA